jgi:hypothetical protein
VSTRTGGFDSLSVFPCNLLNIRNGFGYIIKHQQLQQRRWLGWILRKELTHSSDESPAMLLWLDFF